MTSVSPRRQTLTLGPLEGPTLNWRPALAEKLAFLSRDKALPEVDIVIGHAHFGTYQLLLWNAEGQKPVQIGQGVNVDQLPDKFRLGDQIADLDKRILSWEIRLASFTGEAGQPYSIRVSLTQDSEPVPSGLFEYKGTLEGGFKLIFEHVRFILL